MATRKDQKVKIGRKSKQDIPRPAPEGPLRNERTVKEVARAVMRRRSKALRALAGAPVTAMLIAERSERDDQLAEQIAQSFQWRRLSKAQVENDLAGVRSKKRVRLTVTLEEGLIRAAQSYTGIKQKSTLIQTALAQLIKREAANWLATMGGTIPELKEVRRRRPPGE